MARGVVKTWLAERAIGWIIDEADGAELFFGDRALRGLGPAEVRPGLAVEFERGENAKGPAAFNVRRSGAPQPEGRRPPATARRPDPLREVPVPVSLRALLDPRIVPLEQRHPGLQLDKFGLPCPSQKEQKDALAAVIEANRGADRSLLVDLAARREASLQSLGAPSWTRTSAGPLTLGLARTSALENAGLCLHPIHGFAYLPGTGLKGLARAFAETVWLAGHPEPAAAWAEIERVFGWAPQSDRLGPGQEKPWKPAGIPPHGRDDAAQCGAIVFHDAWPESWPALIIDIVNNHHPEYYQGKGAPGDWDSPVPVYFLAVRPGQPFRFALGRRRADEPAKTLDLARQWLDGALTHLGCGAKTAAGYGHFVPLDETSPDHQDVAQTWHAALQAPATREGGLRTPGIPRAECAATLELVTPAFLAGAGQQAEDCDLRPATLRGQLRWWWRTLHAGYLEVAALRALEAALWGDTSTGGAIRIVLAALEPVRPTLFNYKDRFDPRPDFKRRHNLEDRPDNKTTQGLFYASYGMDEISRGQPKQRFYLEAGQCWSVRCIARASRYFAPGDDSRGARTPDRGRSLDRDLVLDQARAALWLLGTYGGVGSKARKGFGSLHIRGGAVDGLDLDRCRSAARGLRAAIGRDEAFDDGRIGSSALDRSEQLDPPVETPWTDSWQVMDRIGFASQAFAQRFKHDRDQRGVLVPTWSAKTGMGFTKASLGLPRKVHGPSDDREMRGQVDWQRPVWLDYPGRDPKTPQKDVRYGSPLHIHVGKTAQGKLAIRAIGFAMPDLPSLHSSQALLRAFLEQFRDDLDQRARRPAPGGGRGAADRGPAVPSRGPMKRVSGTAVQVKILGPKGAGFRVQEEARPEGSLTVGKKPDPPPVEGAVVAVQVHDDDPRHPQYKWPDLAAKPNRPGGPPRGRTGPRR